MRRKRRGREQKIDRRGGKEGLGRNDRSEKRRGRIDGRGMVGRWNGKERRGEERRAEEEERGEYSICIII